MYEKLILIEFHNSAPYLYKIQSKNRIILDRIIEYFKKNEDFDPEEDSITFMDSPTILNLD